MVGGGGGMGGCGVGGRGERYRKAEKDTSFQSAWKSRTRNIANGKSLTYKKTCNIPSCLTNQLFLVFFVVPLTAKNCLSHSYSLVVNLNRSHLLRDTHHHPHNRDLPQHLAKLCKIKQTIITDGTRSRLNSNILPVQ